jgi:hypothetical protein
MREARLNATAPRTPVVRTASIEAQCIGVSSLALAPITA